MRTARGAKRSVLHDRLAAAGASFRDVSGWEGAHWFGEPAGAHARAPADLGAAGLVRPRRRRAPRRARGGRRCSTCRSWRSSSCRGRTPGALLEHVSANRVDGRRGPRDVHAVAERGRHRRGGPHGHQARRRAVPRGRVRHRAPARRDLAAPAARAVQGRDGHRRDVGVHAAQRAGAAVARGAAGADRPPTCRRRRSRSGRPARSTSASRGRCACASRTWASSGTSCTCRPSTPSTCTTGCVAAGAPLGLRPVGLAALGSLRLEKGYRDYGHDVDNTDAVDEAGLGFAVRRGQARRVRRPRGGRRRSARRGRRGSGWSRCCSSDPEPLLHHAEVVHRSGRPVGYVRAAGRTGTRSAASVGLAMVGAGPGRARAARPGVGRRGALGGRRRRRAASRPRLAGARSTTRARSACGSDTRALPYLGCHTRPLSRTCPVRPCGSQGFRTREQE